MTYQSPTELEHYGVLGMKWGVRKDPDTAKARADKKLKKLNKKVVASEAKANTRTRKAFERNAKAESAILFKGVKRFRASGASRKASKSLARLQVNTLKAKKWADSMDRVFSKVTVSNLDPEAVALGKKYADMTIENIADTSRTINALLDNRDRYKTDWNR